MVRSSSSKPRRRFWENGFDLDLSYITPRVIVVGIPAEVKAGSRNPYAEILNFLKAYHDGRFKIMNLNNERAFYESSRPQEFEERIPVEDHQPAPLSVIHTFCQIADDWLSRNENNVLLTHCKPGKGRVALMICSFLLYTKYCPDLQTALQFYAEKRPTSEKTLMLPSQRRYVGYFHEFVKRGPNPRFDLELAQISFTADVVQSKDIHVVVFSNCGQENQKVKKVLSTLESKTSSSESGRTLILGLDPVWVTGDVKIAFFADTQTPLFYFWFNTAYVQSTDFSLLSKEQFDGAPKTMELDCQVSLFFNGRKPAANKNDSLC